MGVSNSGWGSEYDRDLSNSPHTNEDFEFNQAGKPAKAIIGIGLLVAFGIALTFFHPANHDASTSTSPMASDTARSSGLNSAPGQTTGSAPSTSAN